VATILVTGNDVNIRSILEYRLSKEGYSVLLSEYGESTFAQTRTAQPDLIIFDLAAPHTDGLEFLKQLKRAEDTRDIPVLVLSTFRAEELGSDRPELEGVEFVLMPFSPRQLVADVERILGARKEAGVTHG
jgi:DNA-binding response OmpR family regulator